MSDKEVSKLLTLEDLQEAMPNKKRYITQEAVDIINKSSNEAEFQGESLLKTAITYEGVLNGTKGSIVEYFNAIKFVAYLTSMDENLTEAYKRTFNDREFVKNRFNEPTHSAAYKELTSAASRYRKSKLVVDILTVSQVPLDLIYAGRRYKALDVLVEIMETGKYDRDRVNAAKELLAATKGPENVKIELDVGVRENSAVQQLNDQLAAMAARQKGLIESGISTVQELGAMKVKSNDVIDGELVDE